jgi:2-hydroxychromene-2-carboxylate isomerase
VHAYSFDLYWSMRSPYCYLALDRLLDIYRKYLVEINLRVIYPIAIRDPDFFRVRASKHYRPYLLMDTLRIAEYHNIPFRRPVPDPVVQNLETSEIAEQQPYIYSLTRLAAVAAEKGKGLEFLDQVARLLWDGETDNWNEGEHLSGAIERAGLDAQDLMRIIRDEPERIDARIEENQRLQAEAGHGGVPLMVFNNEAFFGQDRIDLLLWRLQQHGLRERTM